MGDTHAVIEHLDRPAFSERIGRHGEGEDSHTGFIPVWFGASATHQRHHNEFGMTIPVDIHEGRRISDREVGCDLLFSKRVCRNGCGQDQTAEQRQQEEKSA